MAAIYGNTKFFFEKMLLGTDTLQVKNFVEITITHGFLDRGIFLFYLYGKFVMIN